MTPTKWCGFLGGRESGHFDVEGDVPSLYIRPQTYLCKHIRRGTFRSVRELTQAIGSCLRENNKKNQALYRLIYPEKTREI